jgi:thymidylate synthase
VATLVEFESGRLAYPHIAALVLREGKKRAPRGMDTLDLGPTTVVLHSPYDALPLGCGRELNRAIGAGEAVQLVAGRADHALLPRISPNFAQYREADGRFHGAYGDRIGRQVAHVVRKLHYDHDTRQAVITLWNPKLDNGGYARDIPCTVALNFAIIDDKLELRTLMRSNDVWLGFPYDIFQFTQLQLTVARAMSIEPGPYTHSTWSLHLYAKDADRVDWLTIPTDVGPYQPVGFGYPGEFWDVCSASADAILTNDMSWFERPLTESEVWYVEQLAPYRTIT